jgi:hypothetical protein
LSTFVLLDQGEPHQIDVAEGEGGVSLASADVEAVLGWEIRPEGLCKDDICIPMVNRVDLIDRERINLGRLAELVARPLAISLEDRVAYLGPPFENYDLSVGHLDAPDFTLPDLDGRMHSLSAFRGSKVLLAAWASW